MGQTLTYLNELLSTLHKLDKIYLRKKKQNLNNLRDDSSFPFELTKGTLISFNAYSSMPAIRALWQLWVQRVKSLFCFNTRLLVSQQRVVVLEILDYVEFCW